MLLRVSGFEGATSVMEGTELNGDAGADANERGKCTFIEGEGAFVFVDLGGTV